MDLFTKCLLSTYYAPVLPDTLWGRGHIEILTHMHNGLRLRGNLEASSWVGW